jgi:hypothetical protein
MSHTDPMRAQCDVDAKTETGSMSFITTRNDI